MMLRRKKSSCNLDQQSIPWLNDYFGELCFDRNYAKPILAETDFNIPVPHLPAAQVFRALSTTKRTTTGPDGIPFWVWKDLAAIFTPVIDTLWNMSLAQQSWPSCWKEVNINPLAKVDILEAYADFRGINVTPVIARTFEGTVYSIFNKKCVDDYLNDSQFACRSGGSSINALLKMQINILRRQTIENFSSQNVYHGFLKSIG